MKFIIENIMSTRKRIIDRVSLIEVDELIKMPEPWTNNVLWQLGHIVTAQQVLCYKNANVPILIPDYFIPAFKKGSSPKDWTETPSTQVVLHYLETTADALWEDYQSGKFNNYSSYLTSAGVMLTSIDEALMFNYSHENLHFGNIMIMDKYLQKKSR
ncbi:MAG: DinB family protein [Cytophagaceae bacterium]